MVSDQANIAGRDFADGIAADDLSDGTILQGHLGGEQVILVRRGTETFAVGAKCTHYSGPLAEGVVMGDTIRCPWHHACFSLRTGEAIAAPAFDPITCWRVEQREDRIFITTKQESQKPTLSIPTGRAPAPNKIVIIGGGAAGFAAAEMLRRRGFDGELTMLSADEAPPCDRPNLSKEYLAGDASEDWIPLKGPEYYAEQGIHLHTGTSVERIDVERRTVVASGGRSFVFDRLLLATGAEPARLTIPGADQENVFTLRSLADSRAIINKAESSKRAVVIGASFIGLEVAAALRTRGLTVDVVAPDARPMEKNLGAEIGEFVRSYHEQHGVRFHLRQKPVRIERSTVVLESGESVRADFVVAGIGVRPRISLAEKAGLKTDRGVLVNEELETSVSGIFAAGDIARWPDVHSGDRIRVEHWVVAERQGQTVAMNMLGAGRKFAAVPYFWSNHYDLSIQYVGHAEHWDRVEIDGRVADKDCQATYRRNDRILAVATIGRDRENLQIERELETLSEVS
jgi:NADPH-dependent 2,4-dienoyl-CoA reductase/sulfur reductase-like enzyme/nitrite reductase/ring-hydroxylating ferredoxin subunit